MISPSMGGIFERSIDAAGLVLLTPYPRPSELHFLSAHSWSFEVSMGQISGAACVLQRGVFCRRSLALRFATHMTFCSTNTQVVSSSDDDFDDMQRLRTFEGYFGERSRSYWDVGLVGALCFRWDTRERTNLLARE